MSKQIKFIWDFRGPNAEKTAEHHHLHLQDFLKLNAMENEISGVETINEFHHIAYLVVDESRIKDLRDRLKPHRGQVYTP